jgi:hypothetical protein
VTYTTAEGRHELLDAIAQATEQVGLALAALGAAYELLAERSADELEEQLFGPMQAAYGRAKRTSAEFAGRYELTVPPLDTAARRLPSTGAKELVDDAVQFAGQADQTLAALQDSMLPIEVGDPELRARLAEVRELLAGLPERARTLVRTLGR